MIRLIIIIVLAVAGSAGGIWGGLHFANSAAEAEANGQAIEKEPKTEYLTPELFVVPVFTRKNVMGFLVCRLAFAIDADLPAFAGMSEDTMMADLFYEIAFDGLAYIPGETKVPDLSHVADTMVARLNEISGTPRYTGVFIQQVDYFDRDDVRRKVVEDRFDQGN